MTEHTETVHTPSDPGRRDAGRRRLLTGLTVGGAALLGGVVGGVSTAATASGVGFERTTLTVDVACIGDTWRDAPIRNPADAADLRMPFSVEGLMYEQGTIPVDGFVPTPDGAIGHWFCRGWLILDDARPEPHATTLQNYVFGAISEERLFPPDALTSSGLEGTFTDQPTTRSISGGTGRWMGAIGQVVQTNHGVNTTVLLDGTDDPAPNFVFVFDMLLPQLA